MLKSNSATIGVLFDGDGVIIDSSQRHEESWEVLASRVDRVVARLDERSVADLLALVED